MLERIALSVSELNEYTRRLLAGDPLLRQVDVVGEISSYKHHVSGHRYFTLKDDGARVQCVMFRQHAINLNFKPKDGMKVTVSASASVFVRDGSYQLYVTDMHTAGVGELYQKFEALKRKLSAEGLFDPSLKRQLPLYPRQIAIVTSETGAAVRDMIRVSRRRNPNIGIVVSPCSVQGTGAAAEIIAALDRVNRQGTADVILVGRGGGSIEDLWPFNEEEVARAIAASAIPTISCVGHETDFTIADFVADVRAPTPSAAAELAVPVISEIREQLHGMTTRIETAVKRSQKIRRTELKVLLASPALAMPSRMIIETRRNRISALSGALMWNAKKHITNRRGRFDRAVTAIQALNPENVLKRGYSIVYKNETPVKAADAASVGDSIRIRMFDGELGASITSIDLKKPVKSDPEVQ